MKSNLRLILKASGWLVVVALFAGCSTRLEINDFYSDGCSLFPNRSLKDGLDWCDCCLTHDIAYWKGGSEEERLAADEALRLCVLDRTGDETLAELMFQGVRLGGGPYFPTWYRWGYGWPIDRGLYQELTEEEEAVAREKLKRYFEEHPDGPCGQGNNRR